MYIYKHSSLMNAAQACLLPPPPPQVMYLVHNKPFSLFASNIAGYRHRCITPSSFCFVCCCCLLCLITVVVYLYVLYRMSTYVYCCTICNESVGLLQSNILTQTFKHSAPLPSRHNYNALSLSLCHVLALTRMSGKRYRNDSGLCRCVLSFTSDVCPALLITFY